MKKSSASRKGSAANTKDLPSTRIPVEAQHLPLVFMTEKVIIKKTDPTERNTR